MKLPDVQFRHPLILLVLLLSLVGPGTVRAEPALNVTDADLTLRALRVNELGVVPVLMYHAFTTNPTTDLYTRSLDDFRADLTWLYTNNFHLVTLGDLLDNGIDIPAGMHPVVLTFDDAAARQFQFTTDNEGNLVPSLDSAMGVLEAFSTNYPDFGRGAHFAVVGQNCFTFTIDHERSAEWEAACGEKLQWLSDHGYEVGNHTWSHQNLGLLDAAGVEAEVGRNADFIDALVNGPGNRSDILTLPFGVAPAPGSLAAQELANGFAWSSRTYRPNAIVRVDHGMTPSPASSWFDPMAITRINADPAALTDWFGRIERGEVPVYTSDGDPDTVAVPDPVPAALANEFNSDLIAASGKELVRFADDGTYAPPALTSLPPLATGVTVVTAESSVRLREEPATSAPVKRILRARTVLNVAEGPVMADGHTWWRVVTDTGESGWVVEDFLAGPPAP